MDVKRGDRLVGVDLSDVDFAETDFSETTLVDCTLRDAQAANARFAGAQLTTCRFIRCRFAHADFREAVFEACLFVEEGRHDGVQFAFSQLDEARFQRCDLSFARLERSSAYNLACEACNLRGASFHRVDFGRAFGRKQIRHAARFGRCNFELADLSHVELPGADVSGSIFREAVLSQADFEGADLRDCDLFQAALDGAKLARADLRGAEISGLDLTVLGSRNNLKIAADQQSRLLAAMGIDIIVSRRSGDV